MAKWNFIKEAARASKGKLSKNVRNTAKYQEKKERGPVKAFFHITKNENVPAIEQQGLLTNHPNANINSANHPFRKHGTDAGGVWVTTEPTAFPVYGTTIGGKNGNAEARADALSTIKIEVPLPELRKMKAVQDPYGKNILRKGDDPRAIEKSGTWAGIDVPATVLLNDVKPQWLKNIGYVEERAPSYRLIDTDYYPLDIEGSWRLNKGNPLRGLDKSRLRDYSGLTGHNHNNPQDAAKSPYRFVDDYIAKNEPIIKRLPTFPTPNHLEYAARYQGADNGPKYVRDGIAEVPAPNEANRYSADFIPARKWTEDYRNYVKPGESIENQRQFEFAPGAISRGMGGQFMSSVKERNFDWNKYKQAIAAGETPSYAAFEGRPKVILDWDNIVYKNGQYIPKPRLSTPTVAIGAISRGTPDHMKAFARMARGDRRRAADIIRRKRDYSIKYLSRGLGREPTAEELDNWTRIGIFNDIEAGDIPNAPSVLYSWANKGDWDISERLSHELEKRMNMK